MQHLIDLLQPYFWKIIGFLVGIIAAISSLVATHFYDEYENNKAKVSQQIEQNRENYVELITITSVNANNISRLEKKADDTFNLLIKWDRELYKDLNNRESNAD